MGSGIDARADKIGHSIRRKGEISACRNVGIYVWRRFPASRSCNSTFWIRPSLLGEDCRSVVTGISFLPGNHQYRTAIEHIAFGKVPDSARSTICQVLVDGFIPGMVRIEPPKPMKVGDFLQNIRAKAGAIGPHRHEDRSWSTEAGHYTLSRLCLDL